MNDAFDNGGEPNIRKNFKFLVWEVTFKSGDKGSDVQMDKDYLEELEDYFQKGYKTRYPRGLNLKGGPTGSHAGPRGSYKKFDVDKFLVYAKKGWPIEKMGRRGVLGMGAAAIKKNLKQKINNRYFGPSITSIDKLMQFMRDFYDINLMIDIIINENPSNNDDIMNSKKWKLSKVKLSDQLRSLYKYLLYKDEVHKYMKNIPENARKIQRSLGGKYYLPKIKYYLIPQLVDRMLFRKGYDPTQIVAELDFFFEDEDQVREYIKYQYNQDFEGLFTEQNKLLNKDDKIK